MSQGEASISFPSLLQICRNGKLQLDFEWSVWWPRKFGAHRFLDNLAIISPFWATVDEYVAFKANVSKIYYQVYTETDENIVRTSDILKTASNHVSEYDTSGKFTKFKATWVLVVTWRNLCPYVKYENPQRDGQGQSLVLHCRWVSNLISIITSSNLTSPPKHFDKHITVKCLLVEYRFHHILHAEIAFSMRERLQHWVRVFH